VRFQSQELGGFPMHRILIASIAAAGLNIGFGPTASAADIAPSTTLVPTYNWTGFYFGGNAGWAAEHASGTSNFIDTNFAPGTVGYSNIQSNSLTNSEFTGGVQFGYNWQVARNWVLGAEGDWQWVGTKYDICRQTDTFSTACFDNVFGFESISSQMDWLATARARAGVTLDRFMFYGTGGAAFGSIETTVSLNCSSGCGFSGVPISSSSTFTDTKVGWVAGLGVEGMLTSNWSIKAEWLHTDLGKVTDTLTTVGDTFGFPPATTQSAVFSRDERFDVFRIGVNYRFSGPVIVRD
jgi:outer membrane immunogenic protein